MSSHVAVVGRHAAASKAARHAAAVNTVQSSEQGWGGFQVRAAHLHPLTTDDTPWISSQTMYGTNYVRLLLHG